MSGIPDAPFRFDLMVIRFWGFCSGSSWWGLLAADKEPYAIHLCGFVIFSRFSQCTIQLIPITIQRIVIAAYYDRLGTRGLPLVFTSTSISVTKLSILYVCWHWNGSRPVIPFDV